MPGPVISLVVIARNEERDLPDCLSSCRGFACEMIVVDSDSTDRTGTEAARCGAKVLQHEFESYSKQKQWACEQAAGDWILVLDADERMHGDPASFLRRSAAARPEVLAWRIRRRTTYLGTTLRFGPWMGDAPVRLFMKGCASFGDEVVHERIRAEGETPALKGCWLEHRPYADRAEHLAKISLYSKLWADQQASSGRTAGMFDPPIRAAWRLFRGLVLRAAFLDGRAGVAAAVSSAVYAHRKWKLLVELTNAKRRGGPGVNATVPVDPAPVEGGRDDIPV